MIIDVYSVICGIVSLCVLGLMVLLCLLCEFIFKKLNLNSISNFFAIIKWLLVFVLILIGLFIVTVLVIAGFFSVITHIADFIFTLF